jgi:SAM-dependent methyltransferase
MVVSSTEVLWHDLECGSYRADLPLWRELADRSALGSTRARVIDVGAGTGRVALHLARAGHQVLAVDLQEDLLDALKERAGDLSVETACADARTFELDRANFDLCVLPMQTIQLLGGSAERVAFMRRARAHLRPDGLLGVAIVTAVEPFDCAGGDPGPSPELMRLDGTLYVSRPVRVSVLGARIVIERRRRIAAEPTSGPAEPPAYDPVVVEPPPDERHVIELDLLGSAQLEREAAEAGLRLESVRELAATRDHVGSTVVMLRA